MLITSQNSVTMLSFLSFFFFYLMMNREVNCHHQSLYITIREKRRVRVITNIYVVIIIVGIILSHTHTHIHTHTSNMEQNMPNCQYLHAHKWSQEGYFHYYSTFSLTSVRISAGQSYLPVGVTQTLITERSASSVALIFFLPIFINFYS